jgi:hypothetical protein
MRRGLCMSAFGGESPHHQEHFGTRKESLLTLSRMLIATAAIGTGSLRSNAELEARIAAMEKRVNVLDALFCSYLVSIIDQLFCDNNHRCILPSGRIYKSTDSYAE